MFDSGAGRDADLLYQSEQVRERDFFRWKKRAAERLGRPMRAGEFEAMTTEERRLAAGVEELRAVSREESFGLAADVRVANLIDRFVVPPFSVLDTRQGYWQTRRREWLALGIKSEVERGNVVGASAFTPGRLADGEVVGTQGAADSQAPGTSIFDPVLCELAYRWFCPQGGAILDPFAGGSVRGIVASRLGHPYTGIDLSARQLDANRVQAAEICEAAHPHPEWLHGDARAVLGAGAGPQEADLVFTCPPYGDLEVYSDDPADLSAMSWPDFVEAYEAIIRLACDRLTTGRFAVIVVSEVRGPGGAYRGLVPATIEAFLRAGMRYYNECILVSSIGSLPIRIGRQFEAGRKIGRTHQNVLVFAKGEPERGWSYERAAPPSPQLALGLGT